MEKIFFIENGDLSEVNKLLQTGDYEVKSINPVSQSVGGSSDFTAEGNVYAYVVVKRL